MWELLKWSGCGYEYHKDKVELVEEMDLREAHTVLGGVLYSVGRCRFNA